LERLLDDSLALLNDTILIVAEKDGRQVLNTSRNGIDTLRRNRIASASKRPRLRTRWRHS
jgi:hypothetical protein